MKSVLSAGDVALEMAQGIPGVSPGVYSEQDFRAVAKIVHADAGIVLPPGKAVLVYSRLVPLVRSSGLGTFSAWLAKSATDHEERHKLVTALTTNHTFFFREAHHFEHFAAQVRPRLVTMLQQGERVRMWSAGCSSGEEVFSLAMTMLGPDRHAAKMLVKRDLRILASDIDDDVLAKAGKASYAKKDIAIIPAALRAAWLVQDSKMARGDNFVVAPEAMGLVRFRHLNLHGEWPMQGGFHLIMCRNVMIYFDTPTKERLLARMVEQLLPGGYLYIGHSERVSGPAEGEVEIVGPTIYRRRAS